MKFGIALKYDPSGENNVNEGIRPQKTGIFILDGNQQPKFVAERNHPRSVQRDKCSIYYGANSDVQRILVSNLGEYLIRTLG